MDRLVELTRSGEEDAEFGTAIGGRDLGPRKSELRKQAAAEALARGETLPTRSPEWRWTTRPSSRRSSGAEWPRAWRSMRWRHSSMRPRCSAISGISPRKREKDPAFKDRIRSLLRDQLSTAKAGQILIPQVAWGHFAANADGNDLVIFEDESRTNELTRYTFPRQTEAPWLCISDFFRPVASGEPDWASFMVATIGSRASEESLA